MVLDILVALLLYKIFYSRTPQLALVSTIFRLIYVAIHGAALIGFFGIISLFGSTAEEAAREIMLLADFHSNGFMVSLLFFGVHVILVGTMIIKTRMIPRIIGVLMLIAGFAYVADTVLLALVHSDSVISTQIDLFVTMAATVGEVSFLLWLLAFGVRSPGLSDPVRR